MNKLMIQLRTKRLYKHPRIANGITKLFVCSLINYQDPKENLNHITLQSESILKFTFTSKKMNSSGYSTRTSSNSDSDSNKTFYDTSSDYEQSTCPSSSDDEPTLVGDSDGESTLRAESDDEEPEVAGARELLHAILRLRGEDILREIAELARDLGEPRNRRNLRSH